MSFAAQSQVHKPFDVKLLELEVEKSLVLKPSVLVPPLALLILLQILDALLTLKGVATFGASIEGNPLLRFLIQATSAPIALLSVKGVCIGMLTSLFFILKKNPITWAPGAIWGVNAIYIFGAIIPWTYLLM